MNSVRPAWAVRALVLVIVTSILVRCVSAANHTVGGTSGWDLLSDLQSWRVGRTFYTGDALVFTYSPTHDVLEVSQQDYAMCIINQTIRSFNDGETVVPLDQPGTRYFICGTRGHCRSGMKLQIDILHRPRRPRQPHSPPPTHHPHSPPPSPHPLKPSPSNPPPDSGDGGGIPAGHTSGPDHSSVASSVLPPSFTPLILFISAFLDTYLVQGRGF